MFTKLINTIACIKLSNNSNKITIPFTEIGDYRELKMIKIDENEKKQLKEVWKSNVEKVELYYVYYNEFIKGNVWVPVGCNRIYYRLFGYNDYDRVVEEFYVKNRDKEIMR